MSPEIINGFEFDLPTDVFSLGMIFVEILSRRLVDSKTFVVSVQLLHNNHPPMRTHSSISVKPPHSSQTKPRSVVVPPPDVHPP